MLEGGDVILVFPRSLFALMEGTVFESDDVCLALTFVGAPCYISSIVVRDPTAIQNWDSYKVLQLQLTLNPYLSCDFSLFLASALAFQTELGPTVETCRFGAFSTGPRPPRQIFRFAE